MYEQQMTKHSSRDKESCAGNHRRRANFRSWQTRTQSCEVSTALAREAKPGSARCPTCFDMKSNFQREDMGGTPTNRSLVDPEAYDASEQQFAASLEEHIPQEVAEEETLVKKEIAAVSADSLRSATPTAAMPGDDSKRHSSIRSRSTAVFGSECLASGSSRPPGQLSGPAPSAGAALSILATEI